MVLAAIGGGLDFPPKFLGSYRFFYHSSLHHSKTESENPREFLGGVKAMVEEEFNRYKGLTQNDWGSSAGTFV